jgi:hypothetical protein
LRFRRLLLNLNFFIFRLRLKVRLHKVNFISGLRSLGFRPNHFTLEYLAKNLGMREAFSF